MYRQKVILFLHINVQQAKTLWVHLKCKFSLLTTNFPTPKVAVKILKFFCHDQNSDMHNIAEIEKEEVSHFVAEGVT